MGERRDYSTRPERTQESYAANSIGRGERGLVFVTQDVRTMRYGLLSDTRTVAEEGQP